MTTLELTLTGIAHGGAALGRHDGKMIFVPYALPGETVRVTITEDHGRYAHARLESVLTPAPERITPRCPHFGACGGCDWQNASYDAQLRYKHTIVSEQFTRIAGLREPRVHPTEPSPSAWQYRNHMRFVPVPAAFAPDMPDAPVPAPAVPEDAPVIEHAPVDTALGLYAPHSHTVVPIRACDLLEPVLADLYASLSFWPANVAAVHLRAGGDGADAMLVFETTDDSAPELETDLPISCALLRSDDSAHTLIGAPALEAVVQGHTFRVSPASFFQVNSAGASLLVTRVLAALAPAAHETVLDAYCGVGLFSAFLAERCAQVLGVEASPSACADFVENLDAHDNVALYEGAVEDVVPMLVADGVRCDALVLDPPRAGCELEAVRALAQLGAARIVYVSCDVATLARDLKRFAELGYTFSEAWPLDLFPQTYHVEVVALLQRA